MPREGLMVSEYIPTPSGWIAISITAVVLIIFWYLATKDDDPDGKA